MKGEGITNKPINLTTSAFLRFVKQKEMRDKRAASTLRPEADLKNSHTLSLSSCVLSFIWSRDPQAPSRSSLRVVLLFLCSATHTHAGTSSTFDRGRWGSVVRNWWWWGELLLRGMPSANQPIGSKEGLNEANDSTAITAERSTLNIGIPVWNEWKGLRGGSRSSSQTCLPARQLEQQHQ